MKINKRNPLHWLYLTSSSIFIVLAYYLRPIIKRKNVILLYGHKLNGNLLSIYSRKAELEAIGFSVYFSTLDYGYYKNLKKKNVDVALLSCPLVIHTLMRTKTIVSDHGLHTLALLLNGTDIRFFDVWHGIPFKGFDQNDFIIQRKYTEVWVSSNHLKDIYVNNFGFKPSQVQVTGYGRTDRLVNAANHPDTSTEKELCRLFDLPFDNRKIVLFSPTWKQDIQSRSELPFNMNLKDLLSNMSRICEERDSIFIIRSHLNSQSQSAQGSKDPIYFRSHTDYPDSEGLLILTDILICDWSSIAFDFLVLNRPTLFLNVLAPFKKGFSLGSEYRFGKIINNQEDLYSSISEYLGDDKNYKKEFLRKHELIKNKVYGNTLDGSSAKRYIESLSKPEISSKSSYQ